MKQINRIKSGIGLALAACCLAVFVAGGKQADEPAVDPYVYKEFMSAEVADIYDLEQFFTEQQNFFLPITPPDPDFILHQSGSPNVLPFTWKTFPPEFSKNLILEYENSVPVYSVTIVEDAATRATIFLNSKGEKILTLAPPFDYDPFSYLRSIFPDLYAGRYSFNQISYWQSLYDPARIQISAKLIPTEYVEPYLYVSERIAEEAALAAALEGGGFALLRSGEAESNIVFEVMAKTNGIRLVIGYPNDFTNRLDVFTCNDLLQYVWTFAKKELSTTGTNEITWVDTNYWVTSGPPVRFYAAGNADLDADGDGYADAREIMVYRTDHTDSNSRPVRVSGVVSYTGIETGTIYVLSTTASSSWSIAQSVPLPGPGPYTNDIGNNQSYWFKAFRDVNSNSVRDPWEPWGIYSNNSTLVTGDTSGINITMADVPSIWGTISYTGTKTGDLHVIAVTSSNSWNTTYEAVIPWVQGETNELGGPTYLTFPVGYSIVGVPASNYWIRAFIDSDTNSVFTFGESAGQYTSNGIPVSNRVTGINFTIGLDSDGDEMPDWWEWEHGFNPFNAADAQEDRDGDEAQNFKEYLFDINPDVQDSETDGMPDGWEIRYGLTPSIADATNDLDADGLNNLDEYRRSTDPTDPDSDNDQISDGANALTGIYAGPDPNPLTPAPGTIPYELTFAYRKAVSVSEDPQGRPLVAWIGSDALQQKQVRVLKWFGTTPLVAGEWCELNGVWEAFGNSAEVNGVTRSTNGVSGEFDFSTDSTGNPVVVWSEARPSHQNIYMVLWDGTNWTGLAGSDTSLGISGTTNASTQPSLTLDATDRPVVSWTEFSGGTYCIWMKRWNGTNWIGVGSSTNGTGITGGVAFRSEVKVDSVGRPVLVWEHFGQFDIYAAKWTGSTWTNLGCVSTGRVNTAMSPDVLISQDGVMHVSMESTCSVLSEALWVRKYVNGTWQGYGGSDTGVGLALGTNLRVSCQTIWLTTNGQPAVVWAQTYNSVNALAAKIWNSASNAWMGIGSSTNGTGMKPDNRSVRWAAMVSARGSPVVVSSEEVGSGGDYKVIVRQYAADSDGDGLSDSYEVANGLNPNSADSDGDGLGDWEELFLYGTSPSNPDTDGDGLSDIEELFGSVMGYPTNPTLLDSDGDGFDDNCDWFPNSPDGDNDGDGIPNTLDTDDDNDGWTDAYETGTSGTNPLNPDTDCDGIPDSLDTGGPDFTPPVIVILEPEEGATL